MKAIILAAGRGSRLGKLTEEKPKCMVEVQGRSLIEIQLERLKEAGISEIGIVTGYKNELFKFPGIKYFHNSRWSETNMLASLLTASEWMEKESCIVCYSDILYAVNTIKEIMNQHSSLLIPYNTEWLEVWKMRFENPLDDAETFQTDEKGFLTEIGRKASSVEEIKGQYMGLLKFSPDSWKYSVNMLNELGSSATDKMDMTTFLGNLLKRNYKISCIPVKGGWFEIDNEHDLKVYEESFHKRHK